VFSAASPPLTAETGTPYSYQFEATGEPAPALALSGAPSWLSVDQLGNVTGTPPDGITTFVFSVTAENTLGTTTAGPFTVTINSNASAPTQTEAAITPLARTGSDIIDLTWTALAMITIGASLLLLRRRTRRGTALHS
jgi:hypothetical protein